jgi:hypothetical protein
MIARLPPRVMTRVAPRATAALAWAAVTALAVAVGALAAGPGLPIWQLTLACAVAAGVFVAVRAGVGHPLAWFPIAYGGYFLIGAQNWIYVTDSSVTFRAYVDGERVCALAVLGLAAFALGAAAGIVGRPPRMRRRGARVGATAAGTLLVGIGLLATYAVVARQGVLLLDPAARTAVPGALKALSLLAVPGFLLCVANQRSRLRTAALFVAVGGSVLLLGYRTPVVLMAAGLAFLRLSQGRVRSRSIAVAAIVVAVSATGVYLLRLEAGGSAANLNRVHPASVLEKVPALTPLYYGWTREGTAVLHRSMELVPGTQPYFGGEVHVAALRSAFPGSQESPREFVTQVAYGTPTASTTLTPTILGAPYLDAGVAGVGVALIAVGWLVGMLYRRSTDRELGTLSDIAYAYFAALVLLSIHTGLLDLMLVAVVPAMSALALVFVRSARERRHG